ncbi:MAG: long-chain fatty acid--CoA ligase [Thermodesulfobacteriota bacterium]|nr:long-chain fatty acid--CoA ligase [Thermodesulfobacteriota bacterium]
MNVKYLINRAVTEYPDNVAVIYKNVRRTFRDLNTRTNRLANGLLGLGIRKGDRIGILMRNCCKFIETDFALSKTGIVRVPLNIRLTTRDHEYMLNDSGSNTLIFGEEFTEIVQAIKPNLKTVKEFICVSQGFLKQNVLDALDYENLIRSIPPDEPLGEIYEEDLHTLFYTSGTTGKPKGAMLTQKSWANVVINLILDYGPITEEDVILNTQPLSHGAGFFVLPFFVKGATNVLIPEFKPSIVFETIDREKVTVLKLVPSMLYQLMESPEKTRYDLSSLHSIIYGGSPIAVPRLIEAIQFFGKKLVQLYGQAEAPMCISTLSKRDHIIEGPEDVVKRLSSAGKPCLNVEVRIVDENGKDVETGEVGEVIVRGYHTMKGYWNLPEATAEVLRDGWVCTGDLGYFDSEGYIFLVDRRRDVIISGAFNIYPKEIEDIIVTHPKVKEVAVIGVPDEKWGEAVKAVVVPKEGAQVTEQEIIDYCRDHMASFKKPKTVDFVKELPRNPYGKVPKTVLREPYWKGFDRRIH